MVRACLDASGARRGSRKGNSGTLSGRRPAPATADIPESLGCPLARTKSVRRQLARHGSARPESTRLSIPGSDRLAGALVVMSHARAGFVFQGSGEQAASRPRRPARPPRHGLANVAASPEWRADFFSMPPAVHCLA